MEATPSLTREPTDLERIVEILKNHPKGLRCKVIAKELGMAKKDVNRILYGNKEIFALDFLTWKLKGN